MPKIKQNTMKTSMIILAFSLLVTFLCLALFLVIQSQFAVPQSTNLVYTLNEQESYQTYIGSTIGALDTARITNADQYYATYISGILIHCIPFILLFIVMLMIASFYFWRALRHLQHKQMLDVFNALDHVEELVPEQITDPSFREVYTRLKAKFDASLEDYKRLYAYLSHEQKNQLALLRCNMELHQDHDYLKVVDTLTDSMNDILTMSEPKDSALEKVDIQLI